MSGLNPLSVALSGFGAGVLAIALSGFVVETEVVTPVVQPTVLESGGSARIKAAADRRAWERAERAAHERRLREDDEAIILAIAALVTGESG